MVLNLSRKKDIFAKYDPIEEALQEGIDPEEYIIGTYMVQLGPRIDPWYMGTSSSKYTRITVYIWGQSNWNL